MGAGKSRRPTLHPEGLAWPDGLRDHVAMKRVMEPAVRLMNRLRYPQKFALISLLFAIPIALMMTLLLVELHHRMAATAAERHGLEYVVALGHVLEPLERSRGLRILVDAGDAPARELLDQERANIVAAATAVDAINDRLGARLRVKELWQSLRPRIAHPAVEPSALIDQVRRLVEQVADQSKLSLDTDLDSYYLMEAVVRRLPALADNLATVGIGAIEQRFAPAPSAARQSALLTMLGQAHAERDAIDRGHSVAFREDPALPGRLESTLEGSWRGVESMDAIVAAGGHDARGAYEGYAEDGGRRLSPLRRGRLRPRRAPARAHASSRRQAAHPSPRRRLHHRGRGVSLDRLLRRGEARRAWAGARDQAHAHGRVLGPRARGRTR